MSTINVTLPEPMRRFVEEQAARHGYESPGDYVGALVREARERVEREEIEAKLLEATRGGPAVPVTAETWAEIEREGMARLADRGPGSDG